jgi:hypothetical protein
MAGILKRLYDFDAAVDRKIYNFGVRLKTSDPIARQQLYAARNYTKKNLKEYTGFVLKASKERKNAEKAEKHLAKLMSKTESVVGGYKKTRKNNNKKTTKHNIRSRKHRK